MPQATLARATAVVLSALVTVCLLGGIAEIAAAQQAQAANSAQMAAGPGCSVSG